MFFEIHHLEILEDVSDPTQDSKTSHSGVLKYVAHATGTRNFQFLTSPIESWHAFQTKTSRWDQLNIHGSAINFPKKQVAHPVPQATNLRERTWGFHNRERSKQHSMRAASHVAHSHSVASLVASHSRCQRSRSNKLVFPLTKKKDLWWLGVVKWD